MRKGSTKAQWINVLWNSSFVNLMQLPLLCEKLGAIARVHGMQADKMLLHLVISNKLYTGQNIEILAAFRKVRCHYT